VHSTIGAGPAREHWEPEPLRQVCIPERFYWPGVLVIQVEGSSMEPLIRKGAFVGLDTAQTWIVAGEIYAVQVPYEGLTLKRVFVDPENDRLRLQSENPRHPEQTVAIEGREGLVVGKAIWVMQEI
jgi:phage repressor protein C with HTH and peptisase S24 domain